MSRASYSLAALELSPLAFAEIATKLEAAGYHHAFLDNGMLDMDGIGVVLEPAAPKTAPRVCTVCHTPEGQPHNYRHMPKYQEFV